MSEIIESEIALTATFHLTISMRGQRATCKIQIQAPAGHLEFRRVCLKGIQVLHVHAQVLPGI